MIIRQAGAHTLRRKGARSRPDRLMRVLRTCFGLKHARRRRHKRIPVLFPNLRTHLRNRFGGEPVEGVAVLAPQPEQTARQASPSTVGDRDDDRRSVRADGEDGRRRAQHRGAAGRGLPRGARRPALGRAAVAGRPRREGNRPAHSCSKTDQSICPASWASGWRKLTSSSNRWRNRSLDFGVGDFGAMLCSEFARNQCNFNDFLQIHSSIFVNFSLKIIALRVIQV